MRTRHGSVDWRVAADVGLELRISAQPGPDFVPGDTYYVPAEVVSGLRQMLTRMIASGEWPRSVALTSALREEGVSYTALALSAVLSQDTSKPVCLVDTNWYWPSTPLGDTTAKPATGAPAVGRVPGAGLAAVLSGELGLDEALVRVQDTNALDERQGMDWGLALLPAGQMGQGRRVVAARSPELKAAVAQLRDRFEYLILDVPAVLATSDAIALAGLADGCCLVVQQGVTPAAAVQEALAAIRHLPVKGVIMNHVQVHMPAGLAGQLTAPLANGEG
jgi:Mrp family chromosome partitioning ATPase